MSQHAAGQPRAPADGIGLAEATKVWAHIGLNTFGGPAGQIAVMHRELVERRRWLGERRFLHALNYCVLLPGPEAQQLATYIGWLMNGTAGGVVAGSLFVLPGFVAMLALSISYALWGDVTWVAGLLFGLQAAVVAIVAEAVVRIGRRTLRSAFLRVVAAASFLSIFLLQVPFPFIVLVAALLGWGVGSRWPAWLPQGTARDSADTADGHARPALLSDDDHLDRASTRAALRAALVCAVLWLVPVAALVVTLGSAHVFAQEGVLFSKSAVVTFGGAYAVLGYVAQQAVGSYGWIRPQDMIVGLGLAESTPGPLIMVLEFVGFLAAYNRPGSLPPLVAGTLGAVLTVWVTFVPCFLFIFLGAPYVERLRENVGLRHALTAVTAAVSGVILNLAVWFALHTAFSTMRTHTWGPVLLTVPDLGSIRPSAVAISLAAALLVFRWKLGTLRVLGLCAAAGALLALSGHGVP